MEMETSTMPPTALMLAEEDAVASQVLEIIGGITEALQTLEEPEDRDVWLMEEGDDSVFYSDEEHQDTSFGFGSNECKCEHLISCVAAGGHDPGKEESIIDEEVAELQKEVTQQVIVTEQEEEELQTRTPKPVDQSDRADLGAESSLTAEKSVSTCGESLNCTVADMQTQQNTSAEKVNLPVEKKDETPNLDVTKDRDTDDPEQMSNAALQKPSEKQLQVDPEPQQHPSLHVPVGFHQSPRTGYSTLPLPKKSRSSGPENHLSSSKYSTVSYRKIRKGNTRQKIEAFEYMIMNL